MRWTHRFTGFHPSWDRTSWITVMGASTDTEIQHSVGKEVCPSGSVCISEVRAMSHAGSSSSPLETSMIPEGMEGEALKGHF